MAFSPLYGTGPLLAPSPLTELGDRATRHPSLVHVTTHIKTTTVALHATLYSKYVHINMNDIRGQKNVVKLINVVVPTVIFKATD